MKCRCENPSLILDGINGDITCFLCGSTPRDDLGGTDDLARVRYRVKLNRLREARPKTPARLTRAELRAERERKAREMRAAGKSPQEIATALDVDVRTVYVYLDPERAQRKRERDRKRQAEKRAQGHDSFTPWYRKHRDYWLAYMRERRRAA